MAQDFAGTLAKLGPGTEEFGIEVGEPVYGMLSAFHLGACAELVTVRRDEVARRPVGLDAAEAAALPLVALTALQALRDDARLTPGDRVLVHGASGGVGTVAVQIAKAFGAHVTASCSERNHALVRELGADACVDYRAQAPSELHARFDVFFDVYGNQPFSVARRVLTPEGRHVSTIPDPANFAWQAGTGLRARTPGLRGPRTAVVLVRDSRRDLNALARLVADGRLKPVLDRRFGLEEIAEAQAFLETKRARGKVVIDLAP